MCRKSWTALSLLRLLVTYIVHHRYEMTSQFVCSHVPFVRRPSNSNLSNMRNKNWTLKTKFDQRGWILKRYANVCQKWGWPSFLKDWAKLYARPILRFVRQTFKETFRNKTTLQRLPFAICLSSQPSSAFHLSK